MDVASILRQKGNSVETAPADTPLSEVVKALAVRKIGAIVVTKAKDQVVGIISERDLVRALAEAGADALSAPVSRYMTKKVVTCSMGDTVAELMSVMTAGRFRHLPVIEDGQLAGLVSIGDVVKERIAEAEQEAQAMREYIATG